MRNLKTQKGREKEFSKLENSFLNTLRDKGLEIYEKASVEISATMISIGVESDRPDYIHMFASDITIYIFPKKSIELNFGSSGSFTPENKASYWRTIHAATILKNWEIVQSVVSEYSDKYFELRDEIFELNK